MADTGAPHFIPYVEPTDLVRDYPAADEAQALAIAAGLTAAGNAGIGSNVVSTTKTDPFTTTSTSVTDVTNLKVDITPTSAASKILVIVSIALDGEGEDFRAAGVTVARDGTNLATPASGSPSFAGVGQTRPLRAANSQTFHVLDEPNTASEITYQVRAQTNSDLLTLFVNRNRQDVSFRYNSTITAIEVAG